MNVDEKLVTLKNRMLLLANKQQDIMEEIKQCEVLYCGQDWHENVDLAYLSDGNSNMSGYSSAGEFTNNLQFMGELRTGLNN